VAKDARQLRGIMQRFVVFDPEARQSRDALNISSAQTHAWGSLSLETQGKFSVAAACRTTPPLLNWRSNLLTRRAALPKYYAVERCGKP
jgi:hypothetical protein